ILSSANIALPQTWRCCSGRTCPSNPWNAIYSIDAARHHISTQQLCSSSHMPTIDDMTHNLTVSFPNQVVSTSTASRVLGPGFQLQADEIKIEPRLRWDARS